MFLSERKHSLTISATLALLLTLILPMFARAKANSVSANLSPNITSAQVTSVQTLVPATVQWVNTGITVNSGDGLQISATGSWSADPTDGPTTPNGYAQPSGDNFLNLTDIGSCSVCAGTPTPYWGALIGYIGNNPPPAGSYTNPAILPEAQKVFLVGSSYGANETVSGTLWLNFNDDAYSNNTSDNSGQVVASITDTPPSSPLGGKWISPANNFVVAQHGSLHFSAHAYGGVGGVKYVNFTVWWPALGSGSWFVACLHVLHPSPGTTDVYECNWNLKDNGHVIPLGSIKVGFDVYDNAGNRILSPNGLHSGIIQISKGWLVTPSTGQVFQLFLDNCKLCTHETWYPSYYDQKNILHTRPSNGAHSGVDISNDVRDCSLSNPVYLRNPVYAAGSGIVIWAGWAGPGFGWSVVVAHGKGFGGSSHYVYTLYGHMGSVGTDSKTSRSCLKVKVGDKTDAATIVGYQGSSGLSRAATHVHFMFFAGDKNVVTALHSPYDLIQDKIFPASPDFYLCMPLTLGDKSPQSFVFVGDSNC